MSKTKNGKAEWKRTFADRWKSRFISRWCRRWPIGSGSTLRYLGAPSNQQLCALKCVVKEMPYFPFSLKVTKKIQHTNISRTRPSNDQIACVVWLPRGCGWWKKLWIFLQFLDCLGQFFLHTPGQVKIDEVSTTTSIDSDSKLWRFSETKYDVHSRPIILASKENVQSRSSAIDWRRCGGNAFIKRPIMRIPSWGKLAFKKLMEGAGALSKV
jgi:hypothetical protein